MGAGDPNFVAAAGETDFDGHPRILIQRTDIGADEVLPVRNMTKETEHLTIQSAIDTANDLDYIMVFEGIYNEVIDFNSKNISLSSRIPGNWDIIGQTIIDGNSLSSPVVTFSGTEDSNCVLRGFTIQNGSVGGVQGNSTSARLERCLITGNSRPAGAGVYDFDGTIESCKVILNTAAYGGGIAECDGTILNCFVARNTATETGGGLYNCSADIINNTVAKNNASSNAAGLYGCTGPIANTIIWYNNAPENPALENSTRPIYSSIQDSNFGDANNCIYDEPLFVDANDNFHLDFNSPCIDTGDNNSLPVGMEMDINKEGRIYNGTVDIGADEFALNTVDFNIDGIVDGNDLSKITLYWLQEASELDGDLYDDDFIDFKDFAVFGPHWLWRAGWYEP
jgi:hypothetical protein